MEATANINKKQCTCSNTYQDKRYGKGIRVHNPMAAKTGQVRMWRCTSCMKERA